MENLSSIDERLRNIETMLLSQKSVLTFNEVAQFTGLSKSYLYKLTSTGRIPHYKPFNKVIYFEKGAIQNWLLQNPIKTVDDIEKEATKYVTLNKKGGSHV